MGRDERERIHDGDAAASATMVAVPLLSLLHEMQERKRRKREEKAMPKLEEFRKQIVAKIMLRKDNEKRVETIRQVNEMRNIKPAAVLRSPYVQLSSADLYSK
ncbi:hypothetical protein PIB30_088378 [Stylosanthes scabra]|uniref:Uncharacterized protein n=1 Tax=Stylosanthes scabra TaxID=79078 RepID=A0ABU6STX5_9FABA|nr:hypothetical protein [Stylosanthes scabra]